MKKKVISIIAVLALCFGLLVIPAFAADVGYIDADSISRTASDCTEVTSDDTAWDNGYYGGDGGTVIVNGGILRCTAVCAIITTKKIDSRR